MAESEGNGHLHRRDSDGYRGKLMKETDITGPEWGVGKEVEGTGA